MRIGSENIISHVTCFSKETSMFLAQHSLNFEKQRFGLLVALGNVI